MKAIVLSYDRNHPFVDHMIQKYRRVWPGHPFIFRVPYNNKFPEYLNKKYGDKIELIRTPSGIKDTVLKLIEDVESDEWIYWCIDDKYVEKLVSKKCQEISDWIPQIIDPNIRGISFSRSRKLLDDKNVNTKNIIESNTGIKLIESKHFNQFWLHQFFRASVIRETFKGFPDRDFYAKEMDDFTSNMKANPGELFVTVKNYCVFGESTFRGQITKTAFRSIKKEGIKISDELSKNKSRQKIRIGKIDLRDKIQDYFHKIS